MPVAARPQPHREFEVLEVEEEELVESPRFNHLAAVYQHAGANAAVHRAAVAGGTVHVLIAVAQELRTEEMKRGVVGLDHASLGDQPDSRTHDGGSVRLPGPDHSFDAVPLDVHVVVQEQYQLALHHRHSRIAGDCDARVAAELDDLDALVGGADAIGTAIAGCIVHDDDVADGIGLALQVRRARAASDGRHCG